MNVNSTGYTIAFAAAVCVVCATLVAASAVGLRSRQEMNQQLYREKNVLLAAGLVKPGEKSSDRELRQIFERDIRVRLVDLATGEYATEGQLDPKTYDQRKARGDPAASRPAPPNAAQVSRLPNFGAVYLVAPQGKVSQVVLPVEGIGMWGTMYGFLALDADGTTIRGLTWYDQKETPGLGGEVSNPTWQALWHGRKAYDEHWEPRITVVKGNAGPPEKDPHRVDGLSGATITSNGVSRALDFWLSESGYGPFLKKFRAAGGKA